MIEYATIDDQAYRSLFHAHPDIGLVISPADDRIVDVNESAILQLKYPQPELRHVLVTQLFQSSIPELIIFTQEVLDKKRAWTDRLSITLPDGQTLPVDCSAVKAPGQEEELIIILLRSAEVIALRQDSNIAREYIQGGLMEWLRVEKLFKDFERDNELILSAAGEGIYGVNTQGAATFINPAATEILGWSQEDLLGKNVHKLFHHTHSDGSHYKETDCPIFSAFRDGVVYHVEDEVFWHKEGRPIPVEYTSTPIKKGNELAGAVVVFRDVSERKQSEAKLREAMEEVEKLRHRLEMENAYLQEEIREEYNYRTIVGKSEALRQVIRQVELVSPTDADVLITGESGTGKELIARAIHESSTRNERPLIRVNCAAIPHDLFESEFFGHVKGAFTGAVSDRAGRFELAHKGTLFLDEVGEIPLALQGKLLRVIQEGTYERVGDTKTQTVDVRIIAATNRDLKKDIENGSYREDLYFRLNVFPIESAPLRKRVDDIPLLANFFLTNACNRFGKPDRYITKGEMQKLQSYEWPGNIRELENIIERAVIVSNNKKLQFDLPINSGQLQQDSLQTSTGTEEADDIILTDRERLERDRNIIITALKKSGGKVFGAGGAAELLGVKPTTLASRMKKMGIKKH